MRTHTGNLNNRFDITDNEIATQRPGSNTWYIHDYTDARGRRYEDYNGVDLTYSMMLERLKASKDGGVIAIKDLHIAI